MADENVKESQVTDAIPEGMIVEDGVVVQDAPVRTKRKVELPESADRETNEILRHARRPRGVARVDSNGDWVGDEPDNSIFKSKDFLDAFGKDAETFMNQRRGPKNINVIHVDSRPADTGNPNVLKNISKPVVPTNIKEAPAMPVIGNVPRGPEDF